MPYSQFILRQGYSRELELFPHVKEFSLKKNNNIQLDSFSVSVSDSLRIYCVLDGKFEWSINQQNHVLYPGNIALVLPGQEIGGAKGYLDIGTICWLYFKIEKLTTDGRLVLGNWSTLLENERLTVGKILLLNQLSVLKMKEAASILHEMYSEIHNQEMGYQTRFNHMLDSLLIIIARQSTRQASSRRDFPRTFTKLEQTLRENLAHQWTVEEMAALVGLGTTAFTEKVKSYTGFSPLNYLINIRISEAIKLLKRSDVSATEIALETGFYSSQHFSTTFKKLTGHTPGEFRTRNRPNIQL
jgi:AraC-like DNA-binding protein